jgi:large subunit ribosomal protein L13
MKHTIDAANQKLGRVASKAASLLIGKNLTSFARNKAPEVTVEVVNASKIYIDTKKARDTRYSRYSGFPGGLRYESMAQIIDDKGMKALLEEAVKGMLPKNKLQNTMLKNLIITE